MAESEPVAKKQATSEPKTIGTHSGSFQCDEALGVWMLRQLPQWKNALLIRSRDLKVLDPLDIVIDVGGVRKFHHFLNSHSHYRYCGNDFILSQSCATCCINR
eukprot:SAG31_NODE_24721_length_475_cov_1.186170_1_plen_102_part_10